MACSSPLRTAIPLTRAVGAAVAPQFARQQQGAADLVLQFLALQQGRQSFTRSLIKAEIALDAGALCAGADEDRVCAGAQHQAQGIDQQRLASASLAGDDVEAGPEAQRQVLDDGQVADLQFLEHARFPAQILTR